MGNGLLLKQDVDAIHNLIYSALSFFFFPAPPLKRKGKTNKKREIGFETEIKAKK